VETPEADLSAGMQHLNGSYTSYFNRRHRRSGNLFQGRYKAQLIENEGHYWEVSRYIHLNPVRAKVADHPEDWRWSSYRGYHRPTRQLPWVTYGRVLREFGRNVEQARREYRRFVGAGVGAMPPCPWKDATSGLIVGGESFVERIRGMLGGREADHSLAELESLRPRPSLERIVMTVAGAFGADSSRWSAGTRTDDASRAVAAFLARRRYGYRAAEVAKVLGYTSHGGVAMAVKRIESAGPALRRRVQQLEKNLTND
jgi:putative transposase